MKRERREEREEETREKDGEGKENERGGKISSKVTAEKEEEEEKRARKSRNHFAGEEKRTTRGDRDGSGNAESAGQGRGIQHQNSGIQSDAQRCTAMHSNAKQLDPLPRALFSLGSCWPVRGILHILPILPILQTAHHARVLPEPARASSGGKPHSAVDRILLSGGVCSSLLALGKGLVCRSVS